MKPVRPAWRPPARPPAAAARMKAAVRTGSKAMPTPRAAAGAPAAAAIARPSGLRFKRSKAKSVAAQTRLASRAVPPTPNGPGMPSIPLAPFVSPAHSTVVDSTMKPKAMVTMARYGPVTRNAGTDRRAPSAAARTIDTGSAAQKVMPTLVVRIATA